MKQPVIFIGHGSPMEIAGHSGFPQALKKYGKDATAPAAIVVFSAHWLTQEKIGITASARPDLIYDFGGFPEELYHLEYNCPGNPQLAAEIQKHLMENGIDSFLDPDRGLDHGAWMPLKMIFPEATIPVIQISIPYHWLTEKMLQVGSLLKTFREKNILLLGSGNIVHNLHELDWADKNAIPRKWAVEFEKWVKEKVAVQDWETLEDFKKQAPHAKRAHPTPDHFYPLFFVAGAIADNESTFNIYDAIHAGTVSMWSFGFKP